MAINYNPFSPSGCINRKGYILTMLGIIAIFILMIPFGG